MNYGDLYQLDAKCDRCGKPRGDHKLDGGCPPAKPMTDDVGKLVEELAEELRTGFTMPKTLAAADLLERLASENATLKLDRDIDEKLVDSRLPWQPIETAPKGTSVLVSGDWPAPYVAEASFREEEDGWWLMNTDPTDYHDGRVYPKLWMPMPAPPFANE